MTVSVMEREERSQKRKIKVLQMMSKKEERERKKERKQREREKEEKVKEGFEHLRKIFKEEEVDWKELRTTILLRIRRLRGGGARRRLGDGEDHETRRQ
jgi:hypothetical protein